MGRMFSRDYDSWHLLPFVRDLALIFNTLCRS